MSILQPRNVKFDSATDVSADGETARAVEHELKF